MPQVLRLKHFPYISAVPPEVTLIKLRMELQCARQLQGGRLHGSPGPQRVIVSLSKSLTGAMAQ